MSPRRRSPQPSCVVVLPAVLTLESKLAPKISEVLLKGLEKEPEQRWSSAEELAEAFRALSNLHATEEAMRVGEQKRSPLQRLLAWGRG